MKRSLSLRTRVAVAAFLAAGLVVALIGIVAGIALVRNDTRQLDRRLDMLTDAVQATTRHGETTFVLTVRDTKSGGLVIFRGVELPRLPLGTRNVTVGDVNYRVRTIENPEEQTVISLGTRSDTVLVNHRGIPVFIALGVLSMLLAGGFAWLFAGRAVRPLHQLTDQTRQLDTDGLQVAAVRGARESEELAEAMAAMLSRVSAAQSETTKSLLAARDFAASAAHELRTPLTAMRADLDTLRAHDLSGDERVEVIGDLQRAQRRVEATITALGQLASGDLARTEDRELVDIADLLDRVAGDALMHRSTRRRSPSMRTTVVWCWVGPTGCGWPWTTWCATRSTMAKPDILCCRQIGSTTGWLSRSMTTVPAYPRPTGSGCSDDSNAAPALSRAGWAWGWHSWRSRPRCTAETWCCRQARWAGCGRR